jgi:hypothetical protein
MSVAQILNYCERLFARRARGRAPEWHLAPSANELQFGSVLIFRVVRPFRLLVRAVLVTGGAPSRPLVTRATGS